MEMMFRNLPIKTTLLWGLECFLPPSCHSVQSLLRDKEKYNEHFCELMKKVIGNMINAYKKEELRNKIWCFL